VRGAWPAGHPVHASGGSTMSNNLPNAADRLQAPRVPDAFDMAAKEQFDAVCQTACTLFDIPFAQVTLPEGGGRWPRVGRGSDFRDITPEVTFGSHPFPPDGLLVVEDAGRDGRLAGSPLVTGAPHIGFYAGVAVGLEPDPCVGTLCIIDTRPRTFSHEQRQQLRNLGRIVSGHIRLLAAHRATAGEAEARRRAERALAESASATDSMLRAQRMAECAASVGHWRITPEDRRILWSEGLAHIFGRPRPEGGSIPLDRHLAYYHAQDRAGVGARIEAALAGQAPHAAGYQGRARVMRPDGTIRHVLVQGAPDYDQTGALTALYGVILDITDLTASEGMVREANATLGTTLRQMDQGLIMFGADARVRLFNPRASELLDLPTTVLHEGAASEDIRAFQRDRGDLPPALTGNDRASADGDQPGHPSPTEWQGPGGAILEVRRVDLPDGGCLLTFSDITLRRAAQAAVQDSERRYRLLAENATDIIVWCDLDTTRRYVSPAMKTILGHDADESVGTRPLDYVHPEDAPAYRAVLDDLTQGKTDRALTRQRYRHRDGSWVWLENSFNLMRDAETGKPTGYVATLRDVTAGKAVEAALQASEERLALALDSGSDGLWDWDVATGEAWFSDRWYAMLGYASGDLASDLSSWTRLAHPADAEAATVLLREHLKGRTPAYECELRLLRKDGRYGWVLVRGKVVSRGGEGRALRMVGTQIDVDARKRAELALAESEARYRALSDALPQMVWVMCPEDGRATYTNKPFRAYYGSDGTTRRERLDRNHPDDAERMERAWDRALADGCMYEVEGRLRRRDGVYRWHKVLMLPIQQRQGISGWIGTALDIHDSVEARHRLEETAGLLRLAQDAAGASVWEWDLTTGLVRLSSHNPCMHGLMAPEGAGQHTAIVLSAEEWDFVVHPDDLDFAKAAVERAVDARTTYVAEFRVRASDGGGFRWAQSFGRIVYDEVSDRPVRIVGLTLDITDRKRTEQRLFHLARHDPLTDLPNRSLFRERLEQELSEARSEGRKLALFYLDLDRFKQVNDELGHHAGDALLVEVSTRLRAALRAEDTLARLGGDEFAVLRTNLLCRKDAAMLAERLIAAVGRPFVFEEREIAVGLSIGITLMPDHGLDHDAVFRRADASLYSAKAAGRNTFRFHDADKERVA
jgi:diguanylate cyclase (GGDEF)-like protein/PAS domain S-box-containing protein